MIIKASQRGNGGELATHLLNDQDNEYVSVHAINGFASNDIKGAFAEAEIISHGTKCEQYLFSVSLSPPKDTSVSTKAFEDAINRVSRKMGLENQPHVIVFHEKNARRHCHVVYSRIDGTEMKAINMPYYKNKMMEVSKELYLDHGWRLPQGFIDQTKRNPLNYSLYEWQTAKRAGHDPKMTKLVLKECWAVSGNRKTFQHALEQHGFYLAKGNRRGFVAVDWKGKSFSLSRWCDVKPKQLIARLGDPAQLPSVDEAVHKFDHRLVARMKALNETLIKSFDPKLHEMHRKKSVMTSMHKSERQRLTKKQDQRWEVETEKRQARLGKGFQGLWMRMTGKYSRIKRQNEQEAYQAMQRDQKEKDALIFSQMEKRRLVQNELDHILWERNEAITKLQQQIFSKLPENKIETVKSTFEPYQNKNERGFGLDL